MPSTILTIAGVDYDNVDRPAARIHMDAIQKNLDGGYDSCAFTEVGGHPVSTWHGGQPVEVTWITDDDVPHLIFSGTIGDVSHAQAGTGWMISYQAVSRKSLADMVPVTGFDRAGSLVFNRSPEDPYYTAAEAGLDVGQIIGFALCVGETAASLDAMGVGNYASLSPPTLPADTLADLDLLTIVPPQQVALSGEGILNQLEQMLTHWMPKWSMEVKADGTIRFKDTTDTTALGTFVPATVVLPNALVASHPVSWPAIRRSTSRCATRVVIRGSAEVEAALLSTADGTLAEEWSPTEESDWTLADFESPKDAYSEGTITSITGNSATVDPDDATRAWGSNFWSGRQAWIYMTAPLAAGIDIHQQRPVTSNTACTAGGSCTVTWDSSWPIDSTGYTRYRLIGGAGGNSDVGRLYSVREPATGDTGLDTYVGAHLVRRSQLPIKFANNTGFTSIHYPMGYVAWSSSGSAPYNEFPISLEVDPTSGQFRFTQPVVSIFGDPADLAVDYPTTAAGGLPADVRVLAMYSRGTLLAIAPANTGVDLDVPAYEGTGYAVDGLEMTRVIDLPSWTNKGDFTRILELAQQHLDALKDVVHEGSFDWYGLPPWDWWEFGTCVNFSCPPHTGLWEDINAPIRSVRLTWPAQEGLLHRLTIGFSNQRRPHSGDDLYVPASFSGESGIDPNTLNDQSRTFAVENYTRGVDTGMAALNNASGFAGRMGVAGMLGTGMAGAAGMNAGAEGGIGGVNPGAAAPPRGMDAPMSLDARADALDMQAGRLEQEGIARMQNISNGGNAPVAAGAAGAPMPGGGGIGAGDPFAAAQGRFDAREGRERPARPQGVERTPEQAAEAGHDMQERGMAERRRRDRGDAPSRPPDVTLRPADTRTIEKLDPPNPPSNSEQKMMDRGKAERGRLDRGEAPPARPPVTLRPADTRTIEKLDPPDPPSNSEQKMIERGREERKRLDDLD